MNIFIDSKNFFVDWNRAQTLPTCWLILLAKTLASLVCTVWHAYLWHGLHVGKSGNILMKKGNIGILCQSDYLANILAKYCFRVYEAYSANHFLTNIFTHTKLHQHVGLILIIRFRIISVAMVKLDIVIAENIAEAPQTFMSFLWLIKFFTQKYPHLCVLFIDWISWATCMDFIKSSFFFVYFVYCLLLNVAKWVFEITWNFSSYWICIRSIPSLYGNMYTRPVVPTHHWRCYLFWWNRYVINVACCQCKCLKSRESCQC